MPFAGGLSGREVTILGAGVAGLALARGLALRGAQVTVFEQADAVREVGAGLQISPNGARVLAALGLGDQARERGLRAETVALCDGRDGSSVLRMDLARLRPDEPYRFFHRADLIALLAEGARDAGVQIRLLHQIETVELSGDVPRITTAQGLMSYPSLLIGADGLHSPTRRALNGVETPFFTKQIAWRAVIPAEADAAPVAEVHMGPGRHLVSYPLRGGQARNIVAVESRERWTQEGWSLRDDPKELRLAFSQFSPRVRGWLDQVQELWLWGLFRHEVARNWYRSLPQGAAMILGDAAHPTLPFLAQGACMGLEDGWSLCAALDRGLARPVKGGWSHAALENALAGWQAQRATRCARIVAAANANARNYHLGGLSRSVAHIGLRLGGRLAPGLALSRFDWLYGHDVTA
jgi:salicylate hydroxylase